MECGWLVISYPANFTIGLLDTIAKKQAEKIYSAIISLLTNTAWLL
jgi:hypothetical protein